MKKIILSIFLFYNCAFTQNFYYQFDIGKFKSASCFSYSQAGYFYITDQNSNEIIKTDTIGNVIKYIGGYGWDESFFDNPVYVYSDLLNVYVTDQNNHRIQIFDKDLNFITQLSGKSSSTGTDDQNNISFGYPSGCVVSTMGDYYVLDSENKRLLKFDPSGKYILQSGGYDAGKYTLSDPKSLAITRDNKILILDDSSLIIFDQFGNGLAKININEEFKVLNITYNQIVLCNKSAVYFSQLDEKGFELKKAFFPDYKFSEDIVDGLNAGNYLYILTKDRIIVFKMKKAE
jgi:DNA-binding beta-propeller fold protein YncE